MSVHPSPIDNEQTPRRPSDSDTRWQEDRYTLRSKWTGPWGYIVTRVTNSTEFRPGFHLSKATVDSLIEAGWTVTVLSKV